MRRFVTFLNTQLKISLRDMNMPIFALLMPLVIFLVLGILYGGKPAYDGAGYTFLEQSFGAVSAVAICAGGLMGLPMAVSDARERKILKRFRVTPVTPVFLLGVQLAMYVVYCALSLATLSLVSQLWKVRLHGALLPFLGSWLLTMLSTLALGMLVGGVAKDTKQAGRPGLHPLFSHADLFRRDPAHGGHAAGHAEDRQLLPPHPGHHPDEERLSRRPHRQRHPAGLRDTGPDRTLCGPCHLLFPLGIKHAIKKPPTPETSSQRWGFSFQIVTARHPAKSARVSCQLSARSTSHSWGNSRSARSSLVVAGFTGRT